MLPGDSRALLNPGEIQIEDGLGPDAILENPDGEEGAPKKSRKEKILEYER